MPPARNGLDRRRHTRGSPSGSHGHSLRHLPERLLAYSRDVGRDDLSADVGQADPGLARQYAPAHLDSRSTVAKSRPSVRTSRRMRRSLMPGAGWARHAMLVNGVEAVADLVQGIANCVRAVPEGRIEHLDVLRLERRLVAIEQLPHLGAPSGRFGVRSVMTSPQGTWQRRRERHPARMRQ
jgi:hypothetical protein